MTDNNTAKHDLYKEIEAGVAAREKTLIFSYDCSGEVFDVFKKVLADHPEIFWLTGSAKYMKRTDQNGTTIRLEPAFRSQGQILDERIERFNEAVQKIVNRAEKLKTPYDKLLFCHDTLVDETEYDKGAAELVISNGPGVEKSESTGAYGCLVRHHAVCSGYSAALQVLAGRLGIPCARIHGTDLRSGAPHEWNIVELEGEWYHVDVTWDDPIYAGGGGFRVHDYFCVDTATILYNHTIESGQNVPKCTANACNYYVKSGLCLDGYDRESTSAFIEKHVGPEIRIKYPNKAAALAAAKDLFENKAMFSIPAVKAYQPNSLRYSASDLGTLSIALVKQETK